MLQLYIKYRSTLRTTALDTTLIYALSPLIALSAHQLNSPYTISDREVYILAVLGIRRDVGGMLKVRLKVADSEQDRSIF